MLVLQPVAFFKFALMTKTGGNKREAQAREYVASKLSGTQHTGENQSRGATAGELSKLFAGMNPDVVLVCAWVYGDSIKLPEGVSWDSIADLCYRHGIGFEELARIVQYVAENRDLLE